MNNLAVKQNPMHNYFEEHKYIYLTEALTKDRCAELTKMMFDLYEKGGTEKDGQCPLSDSIYGHPVFDDILENLALPLGHNIGYELLPAYTYARIYRPGEILKKHIDRPSCELSATITLGHSSTSEIWPIFVATEIQDNVGTPITINVGDAVMYKGNEVYHWRPEYIGEWQVQVFLHYVDANGPHKEYAYDKRPKLGVMGKQQTIQEVPKPERLIDTIKPAETYVEEYANVQQKGSPVILLPQKSTCPGYCDFNSKFKPEFTFTPSECKSMIDIAKKQYTTKATVGGGKGGEYKEEVRRVDQYHITFETETQWIFERIMGAVHTANKEFFNYELLGMVHNLQLLHYKDEDKSFYDWHTDCGNGLAATRKVSVVAMLSSDDNYEGGKLLLNNYGEVIEANRELGSISMFPSYLLHKVEPVTKGERWVLVNWIHGTERFR